MLGRWRRVGDYALGLHSVCFVADSVAAVITRIDIEYISTPSAPGHNVITLVFSPIFANELRKVCESIGITYQHVREDRHQRGNLNKLSYQSVCRTGGIINISADVYFIHQKFDKILFSKLMTLFDYFNQKMQPYPFPHELIAEFNNVIITTQQCADYWQKLKDSSIVMHKHAIPESRKDQLSKDSFLKRTGRLSLCTVMHSYPEVSDEFIERLANGEDPNEVDYIESTLSNAILVQHSNRALELLLIYSADPFRRHVYAPSTIHTRDRRTTDSFSAHEQALAFGQHEKLDIIINEFTWLTRSIFPNEKPQNKSTVTQARTEYIDNSITSTFHFKNQQNIRTRLIKSSHLSPTERKAIFNLFKQNFEKVDCVSEHELVTIFEDEISGDKYVDLIYHENRIIGFNLFEMVNPKNHKYTTFLHCSIAALSPEYRGLGLMIFLSFRLAYILQLIHPERQLGVYFFALHYNSYRLVLDLKHYPKFQSQVMESIIKDIVETLYPQGYRYHHLLTDYIVYSLRVKDSRPADRKLPLNELIYSREILGIGDTQRSQIKNRAAPVAFIVGDENTIFMREAAKQNGIDFDAHITEYAPLFQKLYRPNDTGEFKLATKLSVLMRNSGALFNSKTTQSVTNRPAKQLPKL